MRTALPISKKHAVVSLFLASSLCCQISFAALQKADAQSANDGALIIDTVSGLEWLQPNYTAGASFSSIMGGYKSLVTTSGFRYASSSEVLTMVTNNFGYIPNDGRGNDESWAAGTSFFRVFAESDSCGPFCSYSNARTADLGSMPSTHKTLEIVSGLGGAYYRLTDVADATNDPDYGNWLVRGELISPVPEPETYAMLLAGLGVVGFAARRKEKAGKDNGMLSSGFPAVPV